MPKFQSKSVDGPARVRLAELLDAKAEALAERQEAQARVARLTALAGTAAPIRAKLAAIEAEETSRFGEWSRSGDGPPPAVDTAARTDLQRELAEAQSRADAGARAVEAVRADMNEAGARSTALDRELQFATLGVALESFHPLADEARDIMARLADVKMRGQVITRVLDFASPGPERSGFAEWRASYAAATYTLRNAFDLPVVGEDAEREFQGSVYALLAALHSDAGAKLDEAS